MKKKLLSLVLAGGMVASTSVSAFAAVPNIVGPDNKEYNSQIKLTGDIEDESGNTQPGTISVSVPTTASFRVDSNGDFIGTTITVNNSGVENVDVFAKAFTDVTPSDNITVVAENNIANRGDVSLKLRGSSGVAYFSSTAGSKKTGVYSDATITTNVDEQKLATVSPGVPEDLALEGKSIKGDSAEHAVRDDFTIVLKIAKSK